MSIVAGTRYRVVHDIHTHTISTTRLLRLEDKNIVRICEGGHEILFPRCPSQNTYGAQCANVYDKRRHSDCGKHKKAANA